MTEPFEIPERISLDFYDDAAEPEARLHTLLTQDLVASRGDYEILADLLDALIRYRHLVREAAALPLLRGTNEQQTAISLERLVEAHKLPHMRRFAALLRSL
jgi:hypothetical protein